MWWSGVQFPHEPSCLGRLLEKATVPLRATETLIPGEVGLRVNIKARLCSGTSGTDGGQHILWETCVL